MAKAMTRCKLGQGIVGQHSSKRQSMGAYMAVFSFLYLKKIKISKIYVGFGKFQKYTPVALWGGDRAQM